MLIGFGSGARRRRDLYRSWRDWGGHRGLSERRTQQTHDRPRLAASGRAARVSLHRRKPCDHSSLLRGPLALPTRPLVLSRPHRPKRVLLCEAGARRTIPRALRRRVHRSEGPAEVGKDFDENPRLRERQHLAHRRFHPDGYARRVRKASRPTCTSSSILVPLRRLLAGQRPMIMRCGWAEPRSKPGLSSRANPPAEGTIGAVAETHFG